MLRARERSGVLGLVAAVAPALCACAPVEPEPSRALLELERLAYVPRYACRIRGRDYAYEAGIEVPIVIDLFEFTRRDLEHYGALHPEFAPASDRASWSLEVPRRGDARDWPAFLARDEAERIAGWRGMRLPRAHEWLHVAVGRRDLRFPWGREQESVANTVETGFGFPTAVGTFENGRSQIFGCYDLVGNVWEWVSDPVPGYLDSPELLASEEEAAADGRPELRGCVVGGAFDTPRRATYGPSIRAEVSWSGSVRRGPDPSFHARRVDPGTLSPSIGARMCADAESYLREHAGAWGAGQRARARVRAVGRRWAADGLARSELEAWLSAAAAEPGVSPGLAELLQGVREAGGQSE